MKMENSHSFLAIGLLFSVIKLISGQATRCAYMETMPRQTRPDDTADLEWSGGFTSWPLIPTEEREEVCMDMYVPSSGFGSYIIYLDEEVEESVSIAKVNYQGTATPEVTMVSGSFGLLGPEIRQDNGQWHLYINNKQDYENMNMQRYTFRVQVTGESTSALISLVINNIDDNPPVIQVFDTCRVPELGDPRLTDCVYQVSDADGEISTRFMTFNITSDREDDQIFYIEPARTPNNWYQMTFTLGLLQSLDFESNALHIFDVTAADSLPNTQTVTLMVQVENVEHRPPRWVEMFAVQQFDEKTNQSFSVRAIDGDTGINKPIYYRLEMKEDDVEFITYFSIETIEGGRDGAILYVKPIDRDALEKEIFRLSIIAYKEDNPESATPMSVVIIVDDVNDSWPEPLAEEYNVTIPEETPLTLNFEEEFGFHDRDLGPHAQYRVHLESEYPPGAEKAFYIAPEVGYQRQTFVVGTLDHAMLDYEDEPFQHITLKVIATDMDNPEFIGVATLHIYLENWNDELPIFEQDSQVVAFDETEGAGFYVANVKANDRDIGDRVEHSLMGNAADYLRIDKDSGDVFVSVDEAFDFHRQNEFFVQVRADDTLMEPYHTATSQITIQLRDINNTPPTLRLPRGSPSIQENKPEGTIITEAIEATDPDTTADLVFEIDWETSYATKQGRTTDPVEYSGCIEIETIFPDPAQRGSAIGRVIVKEIREGVTIDFEEFEVLYLSVRVRDLNTVIGDDYDESTFTITIIDMNDNSPLWAEGTLAQQFRVREVADTNVVIGSVLATDIDGPLYNQVWYRIIPKEDTPAGLVKIDSFTGQIAIDRAFAIDADDPARWTLEYTVIASDQCQTEPDCPEDTTYWENPGNISIEIIDTNNKVPQLYYDAFDTTVYIYENATTGDEVFTLVANDQDRDDEYKTVSYQINYAVNPSLLDFFVVDRESGLVTVEYTGNDVLDRDGDEPTHRMFVTVLDNWFSERDGNRNQNETEVLIVLLDVNDNAPELPLPSDHGGWSVSEDTKENIRLTPVIYAPDRDEPDTDNSRVGYAILDLTPTSREMEVPQLFTMVQVENVTGELETAMPLRGYWGTYDIHIQAYDHGHPQQMSDEVYQLVIQPYNYHAPEFVYPQDGTVVRLARERAISVINGILITVAGEPLDAIAVTDEDGLYAGLATFTVQGDDGAENFFEVVNDGDNQGTLMLTQLFAEDTRVFHVRIRATDGGTDPGPLSAESTITLVFVPTQGDPTFPVNTATVSFFEKAGGLLESFQLPMAEDPKNYLCTNDCHDIYYRILEGNEAGHFKVDPSTNVISLETELDREVSLSHELVVAASNSLNPGAPLAGATLTVTVNVREADPRPYFTKRLYTAGISTADSIGRELLTVQATHSESATITYSLDLDSMVVDSSLEAVKSSAFVLDPDNGVLTLNIQPTAAMVGMFEFDVVATDPDGNDNTAEVKIYLISSQNRVFFIFVNTVELIENERDFIAQTFSAGFELTCNIDQVTRAADSTGAASDTRTEVRAHFIRDDVPVSADLIEELRTDTQRLSAIQLTLSTRILVLEDFVTDASPEAIDDARRNVYVLAGLCAALAVLSLILLITYVVKTRALTRRLEALSTTKYGSVDSGLNRMGLIAPGTNKHAVEGSNPIWNEVIKAPDFDAISEVSGESDLIDIEDMPQFRSDYFPPEDTNSLEDIFNRDRGQTAVANHSNNFGFPTSPFSQNFTDKQFKV